MPLSLFVRPAGMVLRSSALRSSILGLRVCSMSKTARLMPVASCSSILRSNSLFTPPVAQAKSLNQNLPVPLRSASTAVDTHGAATWKYFRYLTVGMFITIPMAINIPNPVFDYALAAFISLHAYWGVDEIITDYVHNTSTQGLVRNLWRAWVAASFFGLLYFTYSGYGIIKAIGLLWSLN